MINFDKALGIHPDALQVFSRRAKVLAANIANADTPNYQARDLDFENILSTIKRNKSEYMKNLSTSNSLFSSSFNAATSLNPQALNAQLLYRVPSQASLDGNTVDVQMETAAFVDNAMRFQATLQFLSGKFKGISKALRGE